MISNSTKPRARNIFLISIFLSLLFSCGMPKQVDPTIKKQGLEIFNAAKQAVTDMGAKLTDDTEYRDLGAYVPALTVIFSEGNKEKFVSSKDFSVCVDCEGKNYYGIDDLSRGDYRANKYTKYIIVFACNALGKITKAEVRKKSRYYVEELQNGKPDGRADWGDWDDEWSYDEQATTDYLNSVRKLLNKPTCNNVDELFCK